MIFLKKSLAEKIALFTVVLLIICLITNPMIARQGTFTGLHICSNVIIPSLFPFTFLSIFLVKSELLSGIKIIGKFTDIFFGLSSNEFVLFMLSQIGGYPLGAKLLNEAVREGKISGKRAEGLITAFINPGPAFCICVVGLGVFSSKEIGLIFYFSGVFASILILQLQRFYSRTEMTSVVKKSKNIGIADNFVLSAYETSTAIISICVFVIFFSFIISYLDFFSQKFAFLGKIPMLLEVTNAIGRTNNVYVIAFLLGFSGLSIWLQILSIAKNFKIKKTFFIIIRILNGILDVFFVKLLLKIFGIAITTSSKVTFDYGNIVTNPMLYLSLLMMVIVFLISVTTKNSAWKFRDDVV